MTRHWLLAAACTLWVASALAETQTQQTQPALPAGMTRVTSVEGVTEYRLPNGLQVLLVPDGSKPTTTVNLTIHAGSRMESYGETGMAHLLEHLMFKGTPTTREPKAEFARRGLAFNGSTSYDRTNYFASFSANDDNLRWYLSWEADAMVNSFIARKDLDTEMTVVRNEMESGENSPGRVLLQRTMAAMYQWHNYGKATIGARTDVENVDIAQLQAFYRRYYQPDNATLIVAGKFDPGQVLAWVGQSFGPIPRPTRVLQPTYTLDPAQDGERTVTLRRVGGTPQIDVGYHIAAGPSPDFAAAELLASILADAPAGRLHKSLVETQLAASTFGFAWGLAEPSPLLLGATLAPGQDVDKARAAMLATLDAVATVPITKEELERARTQWLNNWQLAFTDPEQVGVQLSEAIAEGDWRLFFLERDQIRKLTLADVQRVADQTLLRDNRTVGIYLPTEHPQRAPAPARVDVEALLKDFHGDAAAAQVEAFDPTPANLDARTQTSTLASGLKVALIPKDTRGGVVQAQLHLHYGDGDSLKGQETVAAFAAGLLDKGGAGMTRQQISDRLDALHAELGFGAGDQSVDVSMTTTRENLPALIDLVGKLLRQPAFPADALEEARRQRLASIERARKEPGSLIANTLQRHGNPYPRGDLRYVPTFDEMEQDVRAVTVAQLQAFQRRFYSAASGEFAAVGAMDPAAVTQALAGALGDWRQPADGPLPYVRLPHPLRPVAPDRFMLKTPDKQNANLLGEQRLAVMDSDPDYPALVMANYLFGGSSASRLWTRIREKEGLSYDVRAGIAWNRIEPNSRWIVSAIFAPQNQPKVEAALQQEIARALKDGFTQAELDAARPGLLNDLKLWRAQDGAVAAKLAENLYLGRTFAKSQQLDDALAALTVDQVNAAFRKYVDPARWVVGWGGDFKTLP